MTHPVPSGDPSPLRDLRISDAERSQALDALSTHYVEGRLDLAEFDQRTGGVTAARTIGELEPLFQGMPGGLPFEVGPDGRPRSTGGTLPATTDAAADKDLERVSSKGKIVERVDSAGVGVALGLFLLLQFVLVVPHAWVVWPLYGVAAIVVRAIVGFGDSDEKTYQEIKKAEEKERSDRLRIAMDRRREIEGPRGD